MYSFDKNCVPGTVLGPGKTVMNKTRDPCPRSAYRLVGLGNKQEANKCTEYSEKGKLERECLGMGRGRGAGSRRFS